MDRLVNWRDNGSKAHRVLDQTCCLDLGQNSLLLCPDLICIYACLSMVLCITHLTEKGPWLDQNATNTILAFIFCTNIHTYPKGKDTELVCRLTVCTWHAKALIVSHDHLIPVCYISLPKKIVLIQTSTSLGSCLLHIFFVRCLLLTALLLLYCDQTGAVKYWFPFHRFTGARLRWMANLVHTKSKHLVCMYVWVSWFWNQWRGELNFRATSFVTTGCCIPWCPGQVTLVLHKEVAICISWE